MTRIDAGDGLGPLGRAALTDAARTNGGTWLTPDQASRELGIPKSTLAAWRYLTKHTGEQHGPEVTYFGPRSPRYHRDTINAQNGATR